MMRVLVACEFSGRVRDAFRARGHDAWSCDLRDTESDPRWHIKADFHSAIQDTWDMVGYHYECRVMVNSGVRWLYEKRGRWDELEIACKIFNITLRDKRPGWSENPIQHKHTKQRIDREQDQVIQPWHFGEPYFKATCLWLRGGLAPLKPTNKLDPPERGTDEHKRWSAVHMEPPGQERNKNRSRTYQGIADAMAEQWGALESKEERDE